MNSSLYWSLVMFQCEVVPLPRLGRFEADLEGGQLRLDRVDAGRQVAGARFPLRPLGAGGRRFLVRVAVDPRARPVQVRAQFGQHLGGDSLTLADQRLGARRAGTGVAEGGGAAAGGGRARLHPAPALARRPLLEAAGLTFSVAVSSYG
jgi:hypothetical protein